jgi:hypothetical protein
MRLTANETRREKRSVGRHGSWGEAVYVMRCDARTKLGSCADSPAEQEGEYYQQGAAKRTEAAALTVC